MMGKVAYLIASDLHLNYKNLRSRIDYRAEVETVCNELVSVAARYKNNGYKIVLLLLGDVFNRSYNDIFNACSDNNFFYVWALKYGDIYSVLGNHELTYYSANPFYTLISNIESEKVKSILNRVWEPVGSSGVIRVVDRLEDGEVTFLFNHYGTGISQPDVGKVNIGLFHQDIVSPEIVQASALRYSTETVCTTMDIEGSGLLDAYDYCFFGHMHTLYGTFKTNANTVLCYLASLGRTNVKEINDKFLQRNIPVICTEDGHFVGAFDNFFNLPSREESVKEDKVQEAKHNAELVKEKKIIKNSTPVSTDSIKNVQANLANNSLASRIFTELIDHPLDSYGEELVKSINELLTNQII